MAPIRVPSKVPKNTDMIIIGVNQVQYFKQQEASDFKKSISNYCPCQNRKFECPKKREFGLSLNHWFDQHYPEITTNQLRYPCHCEAFNYSHFHETYHKRYMCNYNWTLRVNRSTSASPIQYLYCPDRHMKLIEI